MGTLKPPIYLSPKPKRPYGRSKMTIAAGFVCLDGIILAADTQETVPGYTKNSTEKIRMWADHGLGIAITGAGDTDLIETIGPEIERAIYRGYSPKQARFDNELREIIRKTMHSAFLKYIRPYAAFPREERPGCDLLVAVSVKNEVNDYECLFKASGTVVRKIEYGAECVGTGLILAKSLIERFYSSFMDLDEAVLAVCYIMHHTKKWVDGCGGTTDLLVSSTKKDFFWNVGSVDISNLEKQFEKCEETVNSLILNLLNPNFRDRIDMLMSRAKTEGERARNDLYGSDSRFAEILKRFAADREPPKPSKLRKPKGRQ